MSLVQMLLRYYQALYVADLLTKIIRSYELYLLGQRGQLYSQLNTTKINHFRILQLKNQEPEEI